MIPSRTKKYVIDVDGAEVSTTLHYFQDVIRKCKVNQHQIAQLPAKTTVVKRSADYNAALVRASHLPKRLWWDASHDAQLEGAFDYHVKHIEQKWLSEEYCQWSKPWFAPSFVDEVRLARSQGVDCERMFDTVPDAVTSSSDSSSSTTASSDVSDLDDDEQDEEVDSDGDDGDFFEENGSGDSPDTGLSSEDISESDQDLQSASLGATVSQSSPRPVRFHRGILGKRQVPATPVRGSNRSKRPRRPALRNVNATGIGSDADVEDEVDSQQRSSRGVTSTSHARNVRRRRQETGFYSLVNKYGSQRE
jgi:hypothetical protein